MSDVKISELPAAGEIDGDELLPLVQDNETKKATVEGIWAGLKNLGAVTESSLPVIEVADSAARLALSVLTVKRTGRLVRETGLLQETQVVPVADVAGSLNESFFVIPDGFGSTAIWFDVDSGGGGSPGYDRDIEVDIASGASIQDIIDAIVSAMVGDDYLTVEDGGGKVVFRDKTKASRDDAYDDSTGFSISVSVHGLEEGGLYTSIDMDQLDDESGWREVAGMASYDDVMGGAAKPHLAVAVAYLADWFASKINGFRATANTWTANQTFNGTNNIMPNQTAAGSTSAMTRGLSDARYGPFYDLAITSDISAFDNVTPVTSSILSLPVGVYDVTGFILASCNSATAGLTVGSEITTGSTGTKFGTQNYYTSSTLNAYTGTVSFELIQNSLINSPYMFVNAPGKTVCGVIQTRISVNLATTYRMWISQRNATDASNAAILKIGTRVTFRKVS